MATVKVKFRPSTTPNKEGTIYYQVIQARIPRQIATDYRIYTCEWNYQRHTVGSAYHSGRLGYLLSVKERIKGDTDRLGRIIQKLEMTCLEYTTDDIVAEYERQIEENSLSRYMERLIAKLKVNGKLRTAETYRSTLNSFLKFCEGKDILIECLSRDVAEAYEAWLKQREASPNTISFYMRKLRAVYNRAVEDDLTEDRSPFRKVYTGVDKTIKRALPMEVLKKIKGLDLTLKPKLDYARDMFMLSFMLRGMSFIDMAYLKKSNLKNGHIIYRRRKTGQQLKIKWTREMQAIVRKYPINQSEYLLPIIRNPQSVPFYTYRNVGYVINRQLKNLAYILDLPIKLTMYVARHSWASAAKAKGIPISVISEGMGHDSELTTQIYLASLDNTVVDDANSLLIEELNE